MKLIPLTQDQLAKVDDEDFAWLSQLRWHAAKDRHGSWRAQSSMRDSNGKHITVLMHCLILGTKNVDHRDHDGLNNQRSNLRPYVGGQNVQNTRKLTPRTSIYKGVYWNKQISKWSAKVATGAKRESGASYQRYLGSFRVEEDAARAYDAAARETFGEFACVNFPEPSESTTPPT